jgi:hypothetical protein
MFIEDEDPSAGAQEPPDALDLPVPTDRVALEERRRDGPIRRASESCRASDGTRVRAAGAAGRKPWHATGLDGGGGLPTV